MIERINLIEKEAFQFSYTRIAQAVAGVVAFCAFLYGVQFARGAYYEKKIRELQSDQLSLQNKQKLLAKAQPSQITEGSNSELQKVFLETPQWSDLLADLSSRLPSTVWFMGVKAATSRVVMPKSGSAPANAPKNASPATPPEGGKNTLVLTGIASNIGDLTAFVVSLQQSPFVSKATLANSKEEDSRFTFEIVCDMVVPHP